MQYYFDTIINAGERQLFDADGQELISLLGRELTIHDRHALSILGEFDPTYMHLERRAAA